MYPTYVGTKLFFPQNVSSREFWYDVCTQHFPKVIKLIVIQSYNIRYGCICVRKSHFLIFYVLPRTNERLKGDGGEETSSNTIFEQRRWTSREPNPCKYFSVIFLSSFRRTQSQKSTSLYIMKSGDSRVANKFSITGCLEISRGASTEPISR